MFYFFSKLLKMNCNICYEEVPSSKLLHCQGKCKCKFCVDCFGGHLTALKSDLSGISSKLHFGRNKVLLIKCMGSSDCDYQFNEITIQALWASLFSSDKDTEKNSYLRLYEGIEGCKHAVIEKNAVSACSSSNNNNIVKSEIDLLVEQVGDALNLRCPNPRCQNVFDDFVGCCCVTCNSCNHQFCAFCMKFHIPNNSQVAHQHVAMCGMNPDKTVYARSPFIITCVMFNHRMIQVYSLFKRSINTSKYFEVMEKCKKILADIGIKLSPYGNMECINTDLPHEELVNGNIITDDIVIQAPKILNINQICNALHIYGNMSLTRPPVTRKRPRLEDIIDLTGFGDGIDGINVNFIFNNNNDNNNNDVVRRRRIRRHIVRERLCSRCHQPGHDIRNCLLA
jgi:hypothetical protein